MMRPDDHELACGMTLLRSRTRRLAKLWRADGACDGYDLARTFDVAPVSLDGLDALAALLTRLAHQPGRCIVRGAVADPARVRGVRRLALPDSRTGEPATLAPAPRRWLALDLDGLHLPPGTDPRDLATCARAVLPRLPATLGRADLIVQATAGHGIKPGARLRLWFWCDRSLTDAELRRWFAGSPVDLSLFSPAQVHYTAAPLFEAPRRDPLPRRLVRMAGACREVAAPEPAALAPAPRPPLPPSPRGSGANRYASAALARATASVARALVDERHRTAKREAWGLARLVNAGLLTEGEVSRAIGAALKHAGKTAEEGEALVRWAVAHRTDGGTLPAVAP